MALRLVETEPEDYTFVCTPTGNEPPAMVGHWQRLEALLGKPLVRLEDPRGLVGWIRHYKSVPSWRQRWCTRILKLEPYFDWLEEQAPAVSYVGLRADEPTRDGFDLGIAGITTDYPLRRWRWGIADVWDYLAERSVAIPRRTDCQLCFYQRLIEWFELWRDAPDAWREGEALEELTGRTFRSPQRDTWPAALKDLRSEFERGRTPPETRERQGMCRACSL